MKLRSLLCLATLLCIFALAATAADVTGTWKAQQPGRDGNTMEITYKLKADGSALTGAMVTQRGEVAIQDGKVNGDEISFTIVRKFQGNEVKMIYKGKVAGDEIKFTVQREGGDQPPREFTAKRSS